MSAANALADALFGPTASGRQCFLEYGGAAYSYQFIRNPTQDAFAAQASEDQDRAIWGALNAAEVSDRNIPGCVIIRPYGCRYPTVHFFTVLNVGNDDAMAIMRFVNQEHLVNARARPTFDCMCYAEAENPGVWRIEGGWDVMMACFTPNDGVHHFGIFAQFLMTDLVLHVLPPEEQDRAVEGDRTVGAIQFQCRARLKYFDSFVEVGRSRQSLPFVCKFHEELPEDDRLSSDDEGEEVEEKAAEAEDAGEQYEHPAAASSNSIHPTTPEAPDVLSDDTEDVERAERQPLLQPDENV